MRRALAAVLVLVAGVGCSGGANPGDGGAGGTGTGTCQTIRLCAIDCGDDTCVTNSCKPRGTAAAQAAFQALYDCTRSTGCTAPGDLNCLCAAQCLQDPPCVSELDACVGATSDPICEVNCH